jgi:hypothetical protein
VAYVSKAWPRFDESFKRLVPNEDCSADEMKSKGFVKQSNVCGAFVVENGCILTTKTCLDELKASGKQVRLFFYPDVLSGRDNTCLQPDTPGVEVGNFVSNDGLAPSGFDLAVGRIAGATDELGALFGQVTLPGAGRAPAIVLPRGEIPPAHSAEMKIDVQVLGHGFAPAGDSPWGIRTSFTIRADQLSGILGAGDPPPHKLEPDDRGAMVLKLGSGGQLNNPSETAVAIVSGLPGQVNRATRLNPPRHRGSAASFPRPRLPRPPIPDLDDEIVHVLRDARSEREPAKFLGAPNDAMVAHPEATARDGTFCLRNSPAWSATSTSVG